MRFAGGGDIIAASRGCLESSSPVMKLLSSTVKDMIARQLSSAETRLAAIWV